MSAVLQFEIDRVRWRETKDRAFVGAYNDSPTARIKGLLQTAVLDTLANGGTLVVVVTDEKVTVVQRAEAEELDDARPSGENHD